MVKVQRSGVLFIPANTAAARDFYFIYLIAPRLLKFLRRNFFIGAAIFAFFATISLAFVMWRVNAFACQTLFSFFNNH